MKLRGAYVQAWVWVDAPDLGDETEVAVSDDLFVKWAKDKFPHEDEIDFDDWPKVSRSYEGG